MAAGTAGALLGAIFLYYLSDALGEERVRRWAARYGVYVLFSEKEFDEVMEGFIRHGERWVFFARLVPGVRSLISIPAGLKRMPMPRFLLYTFLGTVFWNALLAGAGFVLGENWERVLDFVRTYETILWVVLAVSTAYYLYSRWHRRRRATG